MSLIPLRYSAFSSGVVTPALWGRDDIEQYQKCLSYAKNFFVDFRGGIKNRPGTKFIAEEAEPRVRYQRFILGNGIDDFIIVFRNLQMQVMQNGEYLSGSTMALPYSEDDILELCISQKGLSLTITHWEYEPQELTYNPETGAWTLTEVDFLFSKERPDSLSATPSAPGQATYVYAVTSVDKDGRESLPSRPHLAQNSVNFTIQAGSVEFKCSRVKGARFYRWYRSIVSEGTKMTIAQDLGFIGESQAPTFVDGNIIPDFSRQPPIALNPFSGGQVLAIRVTSQGSGYNVNNTVIQKATGPGGGLIAYPVVQDGKVIAAIVHNWGKRYDETTTLEVVGGGGSGAAVVIDDITPSGNKNPRLNAYFQQRRIFSATNEIPNGVWGSAVGDYEHFSNRTIPLADEAYQIYPDLPGNTFMQHILALQDSLLLFHGQGVDRLRASEGRAVTANDHIVEPQSSVGAGYPTPALVNKDIVYASSRLGSVVGLQYTGEGFQINELSIFAQHYFTRWRYPIRFAWCAEPDKLLWVLMSDGTLLSLTYVAEHEVFAWTEHETKGHVLDIEVARESDRDVLHLFVRRTLERDDVTFHYFHERLTDRRVQSPENAWFLDCALSSPVTVQAVDTTFNFYAGNPGTFTLSSVVPWFDADDVGKHIRAFDGLFLITSRTNSRLVGGEIIYNPNSLPPDWTHVKRNALSGNWTMDSLIDTFSGLGHLDGETVTVLADGSVHENVPVTGGVIVIPQPASQVIAGIPYVSEAKTMPMVSPEAMMGRKKRIVGASIRVLRTRGLHVGTGRKLYPMRDSISGQDSLDLRDGVPYASVAAKWEEEAVLTVRQTYPLPAEVLSFIVETEA